MMKMEAGKRRVEQAAKPWLERLARLGYGAKGLVYVVVGILATQAALGRGGMTTDTRGALHVIAGRSHGVVLLVLVAIGFVGYAIWRFAEAWYDPQGKGSDAKGLVKRAGYLAIGVFYLGLALSTLRIVQGAGETGGQAEQDWTARLLAQPFGRVLVGIAGIGVIGYCLYLIYRAFTGDLPEQLNIGGDRGVWARRLASFGVAARSVVFGLIGIFLIDAARRYDAAQAGGLDEALQALASQSHGSILLGIVAVGLVAYGAYMLLVAWYPPRFFT